MQKLSTYELTIDDRHRLGLIDVVPIQKIGQWSYELYGFGIYAAGILLSVEFELSKNCYNSVGLIKGRSPRRIAQHRKNGSIIAFNSSMYRFIERVTLLINCDDSGNVSATCLEPTQSILVRHSHLIARINGILDETRHGRSSVQYIKHCKFLILKILEEKLDWDQETKNHVSRLAKNYWHEIYFMFIENQEEDHTVLSELQQLR